ncbi:hypothetical protein [Mycobacterium sp. DL440]|uniref:hypothetical protein n=1 Tax=Mycobacterium sp. DL440 TaxID=2675523 RepID=UPI00142303C3|nr:hypothetical protein [Mycobacterium sp. DL440]
MVADSVLTGSDVDALDQYDNDDGGSQGQHIGNGKPNQATLLVQMAEDKYGFGVTPEGKPFAYGLEAQHVAFPLRGNQLGLRQRLSSEFFDKHGSAASQNSLAAAMNVLEGKAFQEAPTTLYVRVAGNRESIYIDMADKANRVIRISGGKWSIGTECPYAFRRTQNTGAMQEPVRDGKLTKLFKYLHVAEEDRWLIIGILVDALINPNTAKPIAHFEGEHGTAKSGSTVSLASLIDPTVLPHHGPPKDLQDYAAIAAASWVVALDNLSTLPDWLSDAMCRTATGTGISRRALYTDDDLAILKFRRSIVLNGISFDKIRGDFADRLVSFPLKVIPDDKRLSDEAIQEGWEQDRPEILGKLLTVAATVQAMLPSLGDIPLPRMADFARVLACIDKGANKNTLQLYRSRVKRSLSDSVGTDSFMVLLQEKRYNTTDEGKTAAEILAALTAACRVEPKPKDWPKAAKSVTALLKRNAPGLRARGWAIEDDEAKNKENIIRWFISPPEEAEIK